MDRWMTGSRMIHIAIGVALCSEQVRVAGALMVALHLWQEIAPRWQRWRASRPMSEREVISSARKWSPIGENPRNVRREGSTLAGVPLPDWVPGQGHRPRGGAPAGVLPNPARLPRGTAISRPTRIDVRPAGCPPPRCYAHDRPCCDQCTMRDGAAR